MIFKVCQYAVDNVSSWVFIADVAEVTTGRLFLRRAKSRTEKVDRLALFADATPSESDGSGEQSDSPVQTCKVFLPRRLDGEILAGKRPFVKVQVVYLSLRNGTHQSVAFWEGYLLNDEGRPIERL